MRKMRKMRPLKTQTILATLLLAALSGRAQLPVSCQQPPYAKQDEPPNSDYSLTSTNFANTNQTSAILETMPNFYSTSQASKFRVNVSNSCERNQMHVTIRLNKPFYGLIHAKERRKKPACFVEGTGEQSYSLDISYTLQPADSAYCGMVSHHLTSGAGVGPKAEAKPQTTLSVVLVVRLHKTIEFSDDRYFLLSCANSRCTNPDCSQEQQQKAGNQTGSGRQASFAASESVLSPILRQKGNSDSTSERQIERQLNWATEKCDLMLDMKFQWLLKLCWVLSFLLVFMFCLALYQCVALTSRTQGKRPIARKKASKNNPTLANYPQSENLSWSTLTTASGSAKQQQGKAVEQPEVEEELAKIREDNSFLAQQNQQLMLANLLQATNNANNQRLAYATKPSNDLLIGGECQPTAGERRSNAVVRRRSSIGGSAILLYDSFQTGNRYKPGEVLSLPKPLSERVKSRSQTTIHYEQRQDPFKAVPFSYLNTGYLSDGATSQQVYLLGTQNDPYQQQRAFDEPPRRSLPAPESGHLFQANNNNQTNWPEQANYANKQTFVSSAQPPHPPPPPPPTRQKSDINNNRQVLVSSQFDPEQNSHQLIDLIQQKHRQQIEQASRTAASIAPTQQILSNKRQRAWPR